MLSGKARITTTDFDSGVIGERESVFEALPWSVYAPAQDDVIVVAEEDCEIAICSAPAVGNCFTCASTLCSAVTSWA